MDLRSCPGQSPIQISRCAMTCSHPQGEGKIWGEGVDGRGGGRSDMGERGTQAMNKREREREREKAGMARPKLGDGRLGGRRAISARPEGPDVSPGTRAANEGGGGRYSGEDGPALGGWADGRRESGDAAGPQASSQPTQEHVRGPAS